MLALSVAMAATGARALRAATRPIRGVATTARRAYDFAAVEAKWQAKWDADRSFAAERDSGKEKKYVLDMFPYPSGSGLHVGHPEGYTATDIMSRYWRHAGFDVLHPMGWDAFGLPAEQHAINTGTHPRETTLANIETFKRQLKSLGLSYDWDRELSTTDPAYVKWTQWIFLQLFDAGLAEQREVPVNWCPALGTVLANEEVIDGLSERGSHPVVRAPLRQWVLKITEYADKLLDGLDGLDWPAGPAVPEGVDRAVRGRRRTLRRPRRGRRHRRLHDAARHALRSDVRRRRSRASARFLARDAVEQGRRRRVRRGRRAPVGPGPDGQRREDGRRHGRVLRAPSNGRAASGLCRRLRVGRVRDGRRHGRARARRARLRVRRGVRPARQARRRRRRRRGAPLYGGRRRGRVLLIHRRPEHGRRQGRRRRPPRGGRRGEGGGHVQAAGLGLLAPAVLGRAHPDHVSRPRRGRRPAKVGGGVDPRSASTGFSVDYGSPEAVPETDLPLELPETDDYAPGDDPNGCLARIADWRFYERGGVWRARETNTMPQWAGSCWYYLRYADPDNGDALLSPAADAAWLPVDLYVGGAEHAVLHLLYARFWHKFLYDRGHVKSPEPFTKLVHQGLILGYDGEKMSKSRGNVVNPDDVVNEYGADALRLYEMFMGPLEAVKPWQTEQITGVVRFRDRVHAVCAKAAGDAPLPDDVDRLLHRTMKKVTGDVEALGFNTAISALMVLAKALGDLDAPPLYACERLAVMVSPFAPHLGEECWALLGKGESLAVEPWVKWDEGKCVDAFATVAVQVNGKVRTTLQLAPDAPRDEVEALALGDPAVAKFTDGKDIKKVIYVAGKIVNIVAK